jgi:hypothetical protein
MIFNEAFIQEFADHFADAMASRSPQVQKIQTELIRKKLKGIRGIAEFLDCSTRTAQKLKDKGAFPVYWVGRNLYAYSDEVENGLKEGRA